MAKIITDKNKIEEVLRRGAAEVIVKENLRQRLASGKKLRIKLGIEPVGSMPSLILNFLPEASLCLKFSLTITSAAPRLKTSSILFLSVIIFAILFQLNA